jgi:hypothetical protein
MFADVNQPGRLILFPHLLVASVLIYFSFIDFISPCKPAAPCPWLPFFQPSNKSAGPSRCLKSGLFENIHPGTNSLLLLDFQRHTPPIASEFVNEELDRRPRWSIQHVPSVKNKSL